MIHLEDFPPYKASSLLLKANILERLSSLLFFKNSSSQVLISQLAQNSSKHRVKYFSIDFFFVLFSLSFKKTSQDVTNYCWNQIQFGKFYQTILISKYGVRKPLFSKIELLKNLPMLYKFLASYYSVNHILQKQIYSHIVLINGRDAVGVGAQLSAFHNYCKVICLESGLTNGFRNPTYAEWHGNMHHWKVRQDKLKEILAVESTHFPTKNSQAFISNYSFNYKFWRGKLPLPIPSNLRGKEFICFFTTSEKETTTCPTGNNTDNQFDTFSQTESLHSVYSVARKLNMRLVIRLHPNFTNSKQARNENNYFNDLTKSWENTILIKNNDAVDSYELARAAHTNFTFRSSISAELSSENICVFLTAPTFWSFLCPEKLVSSKVEIESAIVKEKIADINLVDFQGWSYYYTKNGSKFSALKITSIKKRNKNHHFVFHLSSLALDIPRINFIKQRN